MFSFVVPVEACPKCGHDTHRQDAIHFKFGNGQEWATASANAPYGAVTEDEMDDNDPSEADCPDLIFNSKDVTITCVKCGQVLPFTAEEE